MNVSHLYDLSLNNTSVWPIHRRFSVATSPGKNRQRSNGNEGVLHIPQNSRDGTSQSDSLMIYKGHSLGWGSYLSAPWCSRWGTVLNQNHKYGSPLRIKHTFRGLSGYERLFAFKVPTNSSIFVAGVFQRKALTPNMEVPVV